MTLEGKVAMVTGSGRNIGRATAIELARRGANVVVNARSNKAEADSVVAEIESLGSRAIATIADVGVQEQVDAMMSDAVAAFGQVDILINNAGLRAADPITEMTLEQWRSVLAGQSGRSILLLSGSYSGHDRTRLGTNYQCVGPECL